MAKNLTRKGIAFGALVALGASAFAGTPAFAVEPVSLDPYAGTSYSTILGESFKVSSLFTDAAQAGSESLNFLVTDSSSVLDLTASGITGHEGISSSTYAAVIGTVTPTAPSGLNTDKQVDFVGGNTIAPAVNNLTLKASAAGSVKVQAFLDYNGNHKLDAGETASVERTVTFVAVANVTATTSITAPIAGDTSVSAKISFDGLNNEQINEAHVGALVTKGDDTSYYSTHTSGAVTAATLPSAGVISYATTSNTFAAGDVVTVSGMADAANNITGVVLASPAPSATSFSLAGTGVARATQTGATAVPASVRAAAAWSATDKFKVTSALVPALVAAQAVKVTPLYKAAGNPASTDTIGAAALATVGATSVNTIAGSVVASNVALASGDVAVDAAYTVALLAKDATTPTNLPVAGKTVAYTVTLGGTTTNWEATAAAYAASTSTTKATLTINGVTYTNAADLATANTAVFSGVTNADGKVLVSIAQKNLVAGAQVTVTPSVEHATATAAVATTAAAKYTATVTSGLQTAIVAGGTSTASISVVDQFGKALADGYDARATVVSARTGTGHTAATGSVFAPVVGGKATLTFVDNGVGIGTNTYTIEVLKRDATSGSYGDPLVIDGSATGTHSANGTTDKTAVVNIVAAADLVAGKVVLGTAGSAALIDATVAGKYAETGSINTGDFGSYNPADVLGTNPGLTGGNRISGTVTSASTATYVGVPVIGTNVTVAAAGAQFKDNVTGRWATDSITVPTSSTGVFDVQVWSHKSGDVTFTVTAGSQSVTDVITYAAPAATTGAAVTIDAPATALPGTTIKVVATVVDKFGNAVATVPGATAATFKLVIAGIGAGSTDEAATAGTVTKYVVLGAADTGSLTVTATYDADGAGTTSAAVTKTATVKVAAAAAAMTALAVGADQAQVGAAVDVIATATDAAGKPAAGVVVTFDNVGQGYLSATSATTDANGVAKVKLVGNVAGRNTLTATAKGATAANAGVSFGAADANITVKGKRATVTYEFAGLAKVVVSVNGTRKPAVYPADDNEGTYSFNLKAGTNKIVVSIAGKTVDSKTVKIKK